MFNRIDELVQAATKNHQSLAELIIQAECEASGQSQRQVWQRMAQNLTAMEAATAQGAQGVRSATGLTGGEAAKLRVYRAKNQSLSGDLMLSAVQAAMATNEVNAAMGVVCATPTAGSSGTLPGVMMALKQQRHLTRDALTRFLFTAGGIGLIIANQAGIAGATGGCQAEVGSASAMAAAAAVEAAGGTPAQSAQAVAIALSNLLGLVCDPIAGLVEVPCVKRNAIGAGNALIAADLALAGCTSLIPADECIQAMAQVGQAMPASLRETGLGGLAGTPTGQKIRTKIFGQTMGAVSDAEG